MADTRCYLVVMCCFKQFARSFPCSELEKLSWLGNIYVHIDIIYTLYLDCLVVEVIRFGYSATQKGLVGRCDGFDFSRPLSEYEHHHAESMH